MTRNRSSSDGCRCVSLGFTPDRYPQGTHICHLFAGAAERQRIGVAFAKSGLEDGERVEYFADTELGEPLKAAFLQMGLDVDAWQPPTALKAHCAMDVYCPDGDFKAEAMLGRLGEIEAAARASKAAGTRVIGEMTWALRGASCCDQLIRYEAGINTVLQTRPLTVLCQYDLSRFDGATIFEAIRVHPMLVIRDRIVSNPFCNPDLAPPDGDAS
jgi:MEDS: MEthanogen/methylotroph, DcmR Sensory domain